MDIFGGGDWGLDWGLGDLGGSTGGLGGGLDDLGLPDFAGDVGIPGGLPGDYASLPTSPPGTDIFTELTKKVGTSQATSLFQRFLSGDASALDILGAAAPGLIGEYFKQQQSGDLMKIAEQARADRSPFLDYAKSTLAAGPEAYAATGPGGESLNAVLAKLSAGFGNPIGAPTALGIATDSANRTWGDDWRQAANIGLGGNYSSLAQNAVLAGGAGSGFGDAAASVFAPQNSLESLLKKLSGSGLTLNTGNVLT